MQYSKAAAPNNAAVTVPNRPKGAEAIPAILKPSSVWVAANNIKASKVAATITKSAQIEVITPFLLPSPFCNLVSFSLLKSIILDKYHTAAAVTIVSGTIYAALYTSEYRKPSSVGIETPAHTVQPEITCIMYLITQTVSVPNTIAEGCVFILFLNIPARPTAVKANT